MQLTCADAPKADGFDSRQFHQRLRRSLWNFGIASAKGHGPLGDVGFIGPRDGVMAGREASSACRQVRVVDYAFQPAAIARHWAQHAVRGTDAQGPRVRRAPHDVGATCSMCRRVLPVLADTAGPGPRSPLPPPDVGFTPARATVGVLTGSTVRCGVGQRNRVPVAVIPTTNTSSGAIRSSHRALSKSRRRSTRGRGRASWGTK
jgi:hypothetical protein